MLTATEIGAITAGLTEILKSFGVPHKWAPVFAIAIAVAFSLFSAYRGGTDMVDAILSGLIIGLTTTGLYKAGKEISKARRA
ncbi:hypothetical protein HZA38_05295 [Candidatus Peregrinibacteria bacterium]|nr:hypothetical protein [Candidatus Peregrinibacteria bacterium]